MRLIDADKVKNYILTEGFYCDTKADRENTAEEIDLLFPTVKAITIEWIKKFMNRFRLDMVVSDEYVLLDFMLTEWEKENE